LELPAGFSIRDSNQSLVVYRFVQEALTNIFRHARAKDALITLSHDEAKKSIYIRVEDDGVGFAPDKPIGLGLAGMKERVRGLGGRVNFGSGASGGGLVEAVIPSD
jgi:two-component system sensor histidine kinase UhpB